MAPGLAERLLHQLSESGRCSQLPVSHYGDVAGGAILGCAGLHEQLVDMKNRPVIVALAALALLVSAFALKRVFTASAEPVAVVAAAPTGPSEEEAAAEDAEALRIEAMQLYADRFGIDLDTALEQLGNQGYFFEWATEVRKEPAFAGAKVVHTDDGLSHGVVAIVEGRTFSTEPPVVFPYETVTARFSAAEFPPQVDGELIEQLRELGAESVKGVTYHPFLDKVIVWAETDRAELDTVTIEAVLEEIFGTRAHGVAIEWRATETGARPGSGSEG